MSKKLVKNNENKDISEGELENSYPISTRNLLDKDDK